MIAGIVNISKKYTAFITFKSEEYHLTLPAQIPSLDAGFGRFLL